MKRMAIVVLSIVLSVAGSGCYVPTTITKSVTIERDPDGKILKKIEVESVIQTGQGRVLNLEWIKLQEMAPPTDRAVSQVTQRNGMR